MDGVIVQKFLSHVGFAAAALLPLIGNADIKALGDDGRKIMLKDNGSWAYISNDRLATSEDGRRVLIKADGDWEFVQNTQMPAKAIQVSGAPVSVNASIEKKLDIQLQQVVTEEYKATAGKRVRYDTQTVFYFDVKVPVNNAELTGNLSQFDGFNIVDNKGTEYKIVSIQPQAENWVAGGEYSFRVRVNGSPRGSIRLGAKKITVSIDADVFDTPTHLKFTPRTDDIVIKKVNGF